MDTELRAQIALSVNLISLYADDVLKCVAQQCASAMLAMLCGI